MPKVQANNCEMYYEVDDYTDPWLKQTDTIWLHHGVGRSSRFCAVTCVAMVNRVIQGVTTNGQSTN